MILIAGVDNYNGYAEATTVLGAFLGVFGLLLVLFLYVNRKWCFKKTHGFGCCEGTNLPSKYIYKLARKRYYGNSSSDSEEEILRHSMIQEACKTGDGQVSKYGIHNFNALSHGLQHVTITPRESLITPRESLKDPLGTAERGKIGLHSSQSECSSNDSVEISVENNIIMVNREEKDKSEQKTFSNSSRSSPTSVTSIKETRIENRSEKRNSIGSAKFHKTTPPHQNSPQHGLGLNNSSNHDCIVTLSQEPLFDTSDLRSIRSEIDCSPRSPSSICGASGTIEISLLYDAPMRKMTVHVLQAKGIPSRDCGQQTHTQVRLLMLPAKKQKHKTKIRSGENPQFMESFLLHRVNPEEVNSMGLRIRVYGCERMRKERLIGETIVSFATIDLELETNLWLPLEPRNNSSLVESSSDILSLSRSDSIASTSSMQHGGVPELLLGLSYNGITGRLTVEVVKGSHFRSLALNKAPDTYVKLCLVSSIGQEISRAKSSTRRGQPNPLFKETFVFQVALFQLNDVTLMISVYAKKNMKKNEMVGWFSLGLNSSGPEEMAHWVDMRNQSKGELLARWHVLVDS